MSKDLDLVMVHLKEEQKIFSNKSIKRPEDAVELLGDFLKDMDREVLMVINLRSDGVPINCNVVSIGAINETIAHPREILKSSILSNAACIMILHNHPSGSLLPSQADTMMTDRMIKVCDYMGIPLVDHVIVGKGNEYFSFKAKGLLNTADIKLETDYKNVEIKADEKVEQKRKAR